MSREHNPSDDPKNQAPNQTDRCQDIPRRRFLSGITAVGISAAIAGCSSQSETAESGQTAKLVLDGAPNGLRKFEATISSMSGSSITDIKPGIIDADEFQITAGGVGNIEATVRAADLSGSVGAFSDQRQLVVVMFDSQVYDKEINLSTSNVTNDAGEEIPQENIRLELTE